MKKKMTKKRSTGNKLTGGTVRGASDKSVSMVMQDLADEASYVPMLSLDVAAIAEKAALGREERERLILAEQLNRVYERIGKLYENAGFPGNVKVTKDEEELALYLQNKPPNHDAKEMREKKNYRLNLLSIVKSFSKDCNAKHDLIHEFNDWLNAVDIAHDLKSETDFNELYSQHEEIKESVELGFAHAHEAISEIKRIGYQLLEDAGYLDRDEDPDQTATKSVRFGLPPERIIDADSLITNGESFKEASSEVKRVMQDSIRLIKTPQAKSMVRGGLKQYKNLIGATEKRISQVKALEKEILERDFKIFQVENANDRLTKDLEKVDKDFNRVDAQLMNKTSQLDKVSQEVREMKQKMESLAKENGELQAKSELASQKGTLHETVRSDVKVRFVESTDPTPKPTTSSTRQGGLAASGLREEVAQYRATVEILEDIIADLKLSLEAEKELVLQLQEQLGESPETLPVTPTVKVSERGPNESKKKLRVFHHEIESLEKQVTQLKADLASKDEMVLDLERKVLEFQLQQSTTVDDGGRKTLPSGSRQRLSKDKGQKKMASSDVDTKHVLNRLKKSYELEIDKLKDHVEKEKQRADAAIRKQEKEHKEELVNIHKESVHLLRAINRFKDSVAQILDKEDLHDAAFEVHALAKLPTDTNQQDVKTLLFQISGNAVELLVAMESKLSHALMNRRLEMRDNSLAKNFATKDLDAQVEMTNRLRNQNYQLVEKLNATREELARAEEALKISSKTENFRYHSLLDRYKVLWSQFHSVQRELNNLKKDFLEAMKQKERHLKTAMLGKQDMAKTVEDQYNALLTMQHDLKSKKNLYDHQFRLSMRDMRHNLMVLEESLQDHRITKDMYNTAVDVVQRAMGIPVIRLYHMFSRYIAFRRLKHFKDVVKSHIGDNESEKCRAMKGYLMRVERRIRKSMKAWQDRTQHLDVERKALFSTMGQLFTDVIVTGNLIMQQPKLKHLETMSCQHQDRSDAVTGKKGQLPTAVTVKTFFPRLESCETLVGRRMVTSDPEESEEQWQVSELQTDVGSFLPIIPRIHEGPRVEIPRLLDLDVNRSFKSAQKELEKNIKSAYPIAYSEFYDYKSSKLTSMTKLGHNKHIIQHIRPSIDVMIPSVGSFEDL